MKKSYKKALVVLTLGILSGLWVVLLRLEIFPKTYERILMLIFTLMLILVCYLISVKHKVVNSIHLDHLEMKNVFYAIAIVIALRCFVRIFDPILGPFANDGLVDLMYARLGFPLIYLFFILLIPILEELCFRGVMMNYCYSLSRKGLVITSLLFGIMHAVSESNQDSFVRALLFYSIMGWGMSMPYYKGKNIEYSILVHILNNGLAVLML